MSTRTHRGRPRRASSRADRPRLSDVAHAAGVSAMTVVRVLREPAKVEREENWDDGTRDNEIYGFYGVPPYWL